MPTFTTNTTKPKPVKNQQTHRHQALLKSHQDSNMTKEQQIEDNLIEKLVDLKYTHRDDICDKDSLVQNFAKSLKR
jgi:hypothetical protein